MKKNVAARVADRAKVLSGCWMQIRYKSLAIIIVMIVATVVLMYAISQLMLVKSFSDIEDQNVQSEAARASQVIGYEESGLGSTAVQYAYSDDGYAYMASPSTAYITSVAADSVLANLRLNCLIMLDTSGRPVFEKGYDLIDRKQTSLPDGLLSDLGSGSPLLRSDVSTGISGLLMTGNGPMLVSAYPIRGTYGFGTPRGTLIVGRYLDASEIGMLKNVSSIDLAVRPYAAASDGTGLLGGTTTIEPIDGDNITGSLLLRDIYGQPALVLTVDMPRPIYNEGQSTLLYLTLAVLLAGLLLGLMTIFLMDSMILSRIGKLGESVGKIGRENDFSGRVPVSGNDELSLFAGIINRTLDALESSRRDLRTSERRFRGLVENVNDAIWELDDRLRFTYVSPNVEHMLGYRPGELLGRTPLDLTPATEREGLSRKMAEAVAKQGSFALVETVMQAKDGALVAVEVSGRAIRDADGRLAGYNGITRDIRERKAIDSAMRKWANIFRYAKMAMVMCDPDGARIEMMNPAFADLYGYAADEMAGMQMDDLITPEFLKVYCVQIEKAVLQGHFAFQSRHVRKDGTRFPVSMDVTVVKGDDGKVLYQIVNVQDITEMKKAEEKQRKIKEDLEVQVMHRTAQLDSASEALRENERKYKELAKDSSSLIIRTDAAGRIIYFNEVAGSLFGYAADEVVGKSLIDTLIPKADPSAADFEALLKGLPEHPDRQIRSSGEGVGRDGRRARVSWSFRASRDRDDRVEGVLAVGKDVTEVAELRRSTEELARANKELNERIQQLAAGRYDSGKAM